MALRRYQPKDGEAYFYCTLTGEIDGQPGEYHKPEHIDRQSDFPCPMMMVRAADKTAFKSPVTGEVIDSHHKRNEHMKRNNLREVDNTEFKPCYRNPEFAKKRGIHESKWGEPIKREERKADAVPNGIAEKLLRQPASNSR